MSLASSWKSAKTMMQREAGLLRITNSVSTGAGSGTGTSPAQHRFGSVSEHFLGRTWSMCSICSVVFVHFTWSHLTSATEKSNWWQHRVNILRCWMVSPCTRHFQHQKVSNNLMHVYRVPDSVRFDQVQITDVLDRCWSICGWTILSLVTNNQRTCGREHWNTRWKSCRRHGRKWKSLKNV